jgi:hypothetical protein
MGYLVLTDLLNHPRYRLIMIGIVFPLFFGFYLYTSQKTSRWIYWFDDWIFYADSRSVYADMKKMSFEENMQRHPLYSLIIYPLWVTMNSVGGLSRHSSTGAVIALIAAVNVTLVFLLLDSYITDRISVLIFTSLYGVSFSNLVFFSIPETYSLTNIGIILFFILAVKFHKNLTTRRAVILGITAGLGSLLNPPLGLLLFPVYVLCSIHANMRQRMWLALWATLATLFIFLATNFTLFGWDYIEHSRKFSARWASLSNYLDASHWMNLSISFFVFSVISPLDELERSIGIEDVLGYFRNPIITAFFLFFCIFLGYVAVAIRQQIKELLFMAAVAWLAALSLFYVYFNPGEALLYSCQALAPLILIMARSFQKISIKWKEIPFALFAIGTAYLNLACFTG